MPGDFTDQQLLRAARDVYASFGTLLLGDWKDELVEPGLSTLCTSALRWPTDPEREAANLALEFDEALARLIKGRDAQLRILQARLGLDDTRARTLAAIGDRLSLSRERVRQLQERVLRKYLGAQRRDRRATLLREVLIDVVAQEAMSGTSQLAVATVARALFPQGSEAFARRVLAVLIGWKQDVLDSLERVLSQQRAQEARTERRLQVDLARGERADRRLTKLLAGAVWSSHCTPNTPVAPRHGRARDVNVTNQSGSIGSNKLGREVAYESGLEREAIQLCEASRLVIWFQEQPVAIEYVWEGRARLYFPDLLVELADGQRLLMEVKPVRDFPVARNLAKFAAAEAWAHSYGYGFIVTDLRVTLQEVRNHDANEPALAELATLPPAGPLRWSDVRATLLGHQIGISAFATICLQQGWTVTRRPWCLHRGDLSAQAP